MVTDFSAAEKDRGRKFCVCIRLLSGQVFSHFGEVWLAGSHDRSITSGMYASTHWTHAVAPGEPQWAVGIGFRGSVGQSECGVAASCKAVWWDLRLASLLMHLSLDLDLLFVCFYHFVPVFFAFVVLDLVSLVSCFVSCGT